jgi:hypothetical protein
MSVHLYVLAADGFPMEKTLCHRRASDHYRVLVQRRANLISADLEGTMENKNNIKFEIDKLNLYYGSFQALKEISMDHIEETGSLR